jgi:hypothetical protein
MALNLQSNPFDSPLAGLFLKSSDNSNASFNILNRNEECQFHRLELEQSVFEIFPIGAVVVRDTRDITTFIQANNIDYIIMNMIDGTSVRLSITSTTYVNNAASEAEENFVSINVTNSFYKLSQKTSASNLLTKDGILEDRVDSLENILGYFDRNVRKTLGFQNNNSNSTFQGDISYPSNFFCLKMLNPGNNNLTYTATDNAFQYLNYISSLAVGPDSGSSTGSREPRFLFWTEFGDLISFKYFYEDKTKDIETFKKYNDRNYRYSIYNADVPAQQSTNGKVYKKIYNLRTDPTNQWVSKNYFYVRKTPKFLDSIPPGISSPAEKQKYATQALTYHFQDDGEKYNIEVIASSGVVNGVTSGADEMIYEKDWGWVSDHNTNNDNAPATHGSGEFGFAKSYSVINYMGSTGYFSHSDNIDMWKNMFDITEIHPDYPNPLPTGSSTTKNPNEYIYNTIQTNLTKLYKGNTYTPKNLEVRRQIERENFVLYSLCCMGDSEQSFFANLIRYAPDPYTIPPTPPNAIDLISGVGLKWRYMWEGLKFTNGAGSSYWIAMELWESDPTNMSTGTGPNDTWAINLNERTAGLGDPDYYPPGWFANGLASSFKYRPIGCNTIIPDTNGATIAHIVKMYKTTAERLALEGGITMPPELRGKVLYYFSAENVVDGSC